MTATLVDIGALATAKRLPEDALRAFGLTDLPGGGVRIAYASPDGGPARDRLRRAMTGPSGSTWDDGDAPVSAYWRPLVRPLVAEHGFVLLCEGESSCWTAWHNGVGAVGLPGADQVDALRIEHVAEAPTVVIVVEPDDPDTYPDGAAAYLAAVEQRLDAIGYRGTTVVLDLTGVADDLNALYQQEPGGFTAALRRLVERAPRRRGSERPTGPTDKEL